MYLGQCLLNAITTLSPIYDCPAILSWQSPTNRRFSAARKSSATLIPFISALEKSWQISLSHIISSKITDRGVKLTPFEQGRLEELLQQWLSVGDISSASGKSRKVVERYLQAPGEYETRKSSGQPRRLTAQDKISLQICVWKTWPSLSRKSRTVQLS